MKNIEIPIDARVKKVRGQDGDIHQLGEVGTVISRVGPMPEDGPYPGVYGYVVKFDGDTDERATFIIGTKLEWVRQ